MDYDTSGLSYNFSQSMLDTPKITYKGNELTYEDLDSLVAWKFSKKPKKPKKPRPKERVVFDGDYTIYYDKYGKKTIVSKMPQEPYDAEKAVLYALLKSKGIKPKVIAELLDNAIDKSAKRKERERKKLLAKLKNDDNLPF